MFGLTKREQRWKAQQKAAEVLAGLAAIAIKESALLRVAELQADADEISRLRVENAELRSRIAAKMVADDEEAEFTMGSDSPKTGDS